MPSFPSLVQVSEAASPHAAHSLTEPARLHQFSLLRFAWVIEVVCVLIGLTLAISVGLDGASAGNGAWVTASLPFLAASVVELGRIPLVQAFFYARGVFWRGIALMAILIVGLLTFENLVFGFEKAFMLRMEKVREASQHADAANKKVENLKKDIEFIHIGIKQQNNEIKESSDSQSATNGTAVVNTRNAEAIATQAQKAIAGEISGLQKKRDALSRQLEAGKIKVQTDCRAEDLSACNTAAIARNLERELARIDAQISQANSRSNRIQSVAAKQIQDAQAERRQTIEVIRKREEASFRNRAELQEQENKKRIALEAAQEDARTQEGFLSRFKSESQMHRLSQVIFGNSSDENAARTLAIFVTISAAVLALAGSLLAAMHYRIETQSAENGVNQRRLMGRALRATMARIRRRKPIIKTVEKILEVPVDRPVIQVVEKTVIQEVPKEVVKEVVKYIEVPVAIPIPVSASVSERDAAIEKAMRPHSKHGLELVS